MDTATLDCGDVVDGRSTDTSSSCSSPSADMTVHPST